MQWTYRIRIKGLICFRWSRLRWSWTFLSCCSSRRNLWVLSIWERSTSTNRAYWPDFSTVSQPWSSSRKQGCKAKVVRKPITRKRRSDLHNPRKARSLCPGWFAFHCVCCMGHERHHGRCLQPTWTRNPVFTLPPDQQPKSAGQLNHGKQARWSGHLCLKFFPVLALQGNGFCQNGREIGLQDVSVGEHWSCDFMQNLQPHAELFAPIIHVFGTSMHPPSLEIC